MPYGFGDLSDFVSDVLPEEGVPLAGPGEFDLPVDLSTVEPGPSGGFGTALSQFAGRLGTGLGKVGAGLEKEFTETPLKAFTQLLGLGAQGLGISTGLGAQRQLAEQTQTLRRGQKAAQAAATPAVAVGREQLEDVRKGTLPPAMEHAIELWKQQAKADMRAKFAQMGLGTSTDLQSEESRIDLMGEQMKAQLLQSQEGLSLEALQTGVSAGTGVAGTASAQQNTLAALIQAANAQLGSLSGAQA